jgi:ribosomal protein L44E
MCGSAVIVYSRAPLIDKQTRARRASLRVGTFVCAIPAIEQVTNRLLLRVECIECSWAWLEQTYSEAVMQGARNDNEKR